MPQAPVDTLPIDTLLINQLRSNRDFDYSHELVSPDQSLGQWLKEYVLRFLSRVFDISFYSQEARWIWVVAAIVAVLSAIAFAVYKYRRSVLPRTSAAPMPYEINEDDIHGIDFDLAISRALSSADYNEAIRLVYLKALRRLSDANVIDWQLYKTPLQYEGEVCTADFHAFTAIFLRVRYGGFRSDRNAFERMAALFGEVVKAVGSGNGGRNADDGNLVESPQRQPGPSATSKGGEK